jgi:multidrug resistance efflux pump
MEKEQNDRPKPGRIPTPPSILWRNLRLQVLPVVVFFGVAAGLFLTWQNLGGTGVVGVGEGVRSVVTSPCAGVVTEVLVRPYQWVEASEPIAKISPVDSRLSLDLLQSELALARLRLEPSLADQHALDYERLRVEGLRLKQELALAEVNLQHAEGVLKRNDSLRKDNLVSADTYDLSLRDREAFKSEIAEKQSALSEVKDRLAALGPLGLPESPGTNQNLGDLVKHLEDKLSEAQARQGPVTLRAPISGLVHIVNRQAGEFVLEGDPILNVNANRSDRIVAYVRQPYPIDPEPGMKVEVLTRQRKRARFLSEITQIGAQVEAITNSTAYLRPGFLVDVGLPVVIGIPPEVSIRPGEAVDILFLPQAAGQNPGDKAAVQARNQL